MGAGTPDADPMKVFKASVRYRAASGAVSYFNSSDPRVPLAYCEESISGVVDVLIATLGAAAAYDIVQKIADGIGSQTPRPEFTTSNGDRL